MNTEFRTYLIERLHLLTNRQACEPVKAYVEENLQIAKEELKATHGHDAVRAALIRLTTLTETPLDEGTSEAALDAYLQQVKDEQQTLLLYRTPSWVGLCVFMLSGDVLKAVRYAGAGFSMVGERAAAGSILWAMAETAQNEGWTDLSEPLLSQASGMPFDEEEEKMQVEYLIACSELTKGEDPTERLIQIVENEHTVDETAANANWILGIRAKEEGHFAAAAGYFERTLALVDEDEVPLTARIRQELDELASIH